MNESQKTFRDELLDMEKANTHYKEKYEKEIKQMFEQKLTGLQRWGQVLGLAMGLGFFVLFGALAIIVPKEFPLWARSIWILGAVFGLVLAGLSVWILKKGTVNLKTDNMAAAGLGWGFIVIIATYSLGLLRRPAGANNRCSHARLNTYFRSNGRCRVAQGNHTAF